MRVNASALAVKFRARSAWLNPVFHLEDRPSDSSLALGLNGQFDRLAVAFVAKVRSCFAN
jgi:hypothetical protein